VRTLYEQIQIALDLVEDVPPGSPTAGEAAAAAGMSASGFHRWFPAVIGYRFGEYVRKRRLTDATWALEKDDWTVLEIAIRSGYTSHAGFTRAFAREFGMSPSRYRRERPSVVKTRPIDVVGEVNMGVVTKTLPDLHVVHFDGFRPEPEQTAGRRMTEWVASHPGLVGRHRIFGHNIDRDGNLSHEPANEGYRIEVTVPDGTTPAEADRDIHTMRAGRFIVTGIEGSFADDPTGAWITEGWRRLQEMLRRSELDIHPSCRWFEEWLEPVTPGHTRLDLYLEVDVAE
jgi:AraC-like DNA-binding protein